MTSVERTMNYSSLIIRTLDVVSEPCVKGPLDLAARTGWSVTTASSVLKFGVMKGFIYRDPALGIFRKKRYHG